MRHSQGLVIVASLWVSRSGSVKAIQRVQMRESTPLLLLGYRDPRLLPAINPGRSREASLVLTSAAATTTRTTRSQPVASSTRRYDGAGHGKACWRFARRVRAVEGAGRLFSTPSRPACGRASSLGPSSAGNATTGTGVPASPSTIGGARAVTSAPAGAHLGHAPGDSNGQSRLPTDSSTWRFTCANAVDLHPVRDHTVYGMQEVRAFGFASGSVRSLDDSVSSCRR
jgi:hypothetical protein